MTGCVLYSKQLKIYSSFCKVTIEELLPGYLNLKREFSKKSKF